MAKKIQRRLDRNGIGLDLEQLVRRLELLVDLARRVHVTLVEGPDHSPDLRSDDVRVYTNTADSSELEEREGENVVPRVERAVQLADDTTRIPSPPFSTRCTASSPKRSKSIVPSLLKGVTIAVRASPSTPLVYSAWI